ncbi:hypothetical protein TWF718_005736 [Orbilia javanica]|uniref:Uncharacterized protein n=1 Tax=Orbilia javanica TaxID=47235 RepID=A0AAN8NXH8_9PEZI
MPRAVKETAKEAAPRKLRCKISGNASAPLPENPSSENATGRILRPRKARRTPWEQAPSPPRKRGRPSDESDGNAAASKRHKETHEAPLPGVERDTRDGVRGVTPVATPEREGSQIPNLQKELTNAQERVRVAEAKLAKAEKKIRQLQGRTERLDESLKNEKVRSHVSELRRQDAVFRLEQHIENAKMPSVIFGEDVEASMKDLFGGKLASWAVDSFEEIDIATIVSELEVLDEDPAFRGLFSFDCFNVSISEALKSLGGPAFFEALVASTLAERFFDNPFFACPPLMRDALTDVRDQIAKTDLPAACKWTADTVAQIATSDKIGVERYLEGFAETLNRYLRTVINKNDYLPADNIEALERRLRAVVREAAELALKWHSHEQKFGVFKTPGKAFWEEGLEGNCVPYRRDLEEVRRVGAWEVVATIRPGFVIYTSPVHGRRLSVPGVWTKAILALRQVVEAG